MKLSGSWVVALFGGAITILTTVATATLITSLFAPSSAFSTVASFGVAMILYPSGVPVLLAGGFAGFSLRHLSHRKRRDRRLSSDAPTSGKSMG